MEPTRRRTLLLIACAYLLRLLVMPTMGQHDVLFMPWMARFVAQGHWNLYAFLRERFGDLVMTSPGVWAPYPYGCWATLAAWIAALDGVGLVDLAHWGGVWEVAHPARLVFLCKAPALALDLAVGYGLFRLGGGGRRGRTAWLLWAWSPAVLYTAFMMGQNDMYCTALMFGGALAASKAIAAPSGPPRAALGWIALSALLLGAGGTFKVFPLFLLPVLAPLLLARWWQRLLYVAVGGGLFALVALPFLGTPTFLEGVLLNREGVSVLAESGFLGVPVAPYLAAYAVLVIALWSRAEPSTREDEPWLLSLLVVGGLFLLVRTAFYWQMWLAPYAVLLAARRRIGWGAWLALQAAFGLSLAFLHEELAAALPIHLSDEFRLVSVSTALWASRPSLARFLDPLRVLVSAGSMGALVLLLAEAAREWLRPRRERVHAAAAWVAAPVLLMALVIAGGVYASRGMVREPALNATGQIALSEGEDASQGMLVDGWRATGVWLRATVATGEPVSLGVTLTTADDGAQVADVAIELAGTPGEQYRYAWLEHPVALRDGAAYRLSVRVLTPGATVLLPRGDRPGGSYIAGGEEHPGGLGVGLLRAFRPPVALEQLVRRNVLGDAALLALLALAGAGTLLVLSRALRAATPRSEPAPEPAVEGPAGA